MLFIRTVVKQAVGVLLVMLATRDIRLSWAHALESDIDCATTTFRVKLWTPVAWQRCVHGFLIYIYIYIYTHTHADWRRATELVHATVREVDMANLVSKVAVVGLDTRGMFAARCIGGVPRLSTHVPHVHSTACSPRTCARRAKTSSGICPWLSVALYASPPMGRAVG